MPGKINPGRIIVIEGADGTGKATVTEQVLALLNKRKPLGNRAVLAQSFPNYPSHFGKLIRAYLDGDRAAKPLRVPADIRLDPTCAAVNYSLDRHWTFQQTMAPNLKRGHWYLCDRYYISNMAHQGSRIGSVKKRLEFFDRLKLLECGYFQLPEPAAVVILHLPEKIRAERTEKRRKSASKAGSLGGQVGKTDIHEQDPTHMRRAADTYRQMANHFNWPLVSGVQNGRELSPEEMAEAVYEKILSQLAIAS